LFTSHPPDYAALRVRLLSQPRKQERTGPVNQDEQGRRPRLIELPSAMTRRAALVSAAASATLPLVGRRARAAGEPIVIGWVGPLSPPGGYAEGILMKNAAEMGAAEINAQGGVLGRPLQIVYTDTRGMPAEGRTAAERLVQESKVVAVFGEFHSPVALAEMEVFRKYHIPFMACDVWSDQITAKGYAEVFRNAPTISLIDTQIGQWMTKVGFKKVALLAEKNDVGLAARTAVANELKKANIPNDAVDAEPNLTDFTAQILRFKNNSPGYDFFYTAFSEAGAYDLIRQAKELGFSPTKSCGMYNSGGEATDPTFWENVKEAGVGLVTENVGLPQAGWNDKTRAFVKAFTEKYKAEPPGAVMESYDGLYLLADAIQRAGSTNADGIIKALETTGYVGVRGQYSFSADKELPWHWHQFMQAPLTLIQYNKLNQTVNDAPILWPRKFATVDQLYTPPA
jgi:branched-chain amino acid transport system substrate-binding protein